SDPGPVFHTIVSIKNDGHYFCRAGGNRPDGLNEPVTYRTENSDDLTLQEYSTIVLFRKSKAGSREISH
ncbi:hypothetical protein, partial [Escherichia coli]